MTGQEALEQALRLLHYTDQDGQPESQFREDSRHQGLAAVNQVVADLWAVEQEQPLVPLDRLDDEVITKFPSDEITSCGFPGCLFP